MLIASHSIIPSEMKEHLQAHCIQLARDGTVLRAAVPKSLIVSVTHQPNSYIAAVISVVRSVNQCLCMLLV